MCINFSVSGINDLFALMLKTVCEASARMNLFEVTDRDAVDNLGTLSKLLGLDASAQVLKVDRKIARAHLAGEKVGDFMLAASVKDPKIGPGHIGRRKEGKSLNVIPVWVAKEEVDLLWFTAASHQVKAKSPDTGPGIQDKQGVESSDFDAGSVSPKNATRVVGSRDRASYAPKLNKEHGLAPFTEFVDEVTQLNDVAMVELSGVDFRSV